MGGSIAVGLRWQDANGEVRTAAIERWTNDLPHRLFRASTLAGGAGLQALVDEATPAAQWPNSRRCSRLKPTEYGIVCYDAIERALFSANGYSYMDMLRAGPISTAWLDELGGLASLEAEGRVDIYPGFATQRHGAGEILLERPDDDRPVPPGMRPAGNRADRWMPATPADRVSALAVVQHMMATLQAKGIAVPGDALAAQCEAVPALLYQHGRALQLTAADLYPPGFDAERGVTALWRPTAFRFRQCGDWSDADSPAQLDAFLEQFQWPTELRPRHARPRTR